jgi:hypothetical protein
MASVVNDVLSEIFCRASVECRRFECAVSSV